MEDQIQIKVRGKKGEGVEKMGGLETKIWVNDGMCREIKDG